MKVYRDTIIAVCSQSGASMVYILNDSGETIRQFSLGVLMSYPVLPRVKTRCMFPAPIPSSSEWRWRSRFRTVRNSGNSTPARPTRIAVRWMTVVIFYFAGSQLKFPDSGVVLERVLIKLNPQGEILWKNEWLSRESQETNMENWNRAVGVSTAKNMVVVGGSIQKAIRTPATSPLILKDSRPRPKRLSGKRFGIIRPLRLQV